MIICVSLTPAVDKTLIVPGFAPGRTNRASVERIDPGGKGTNVAKAAARLGCPVTVVGFAAGQGGRFIRAALESLGILPDLVEAPGETRVNLKVKDPATGTETEINEPSFAVAAEQWRRLKRKLEEHAAGAAVVVFSGSLPPGAPDATYADLLQIAKACGARTVLDTSGAALREGLSGRPDLVKPNRDEAAELLGEAIEGISPAVDAARRLQAMGPPRVAISLGRQGAAAADGSQAWHAAAPAIEVRSSVGSGDAMVAAFAWAMERGLDFPEALRWAVAAGTASAAAAGSGVADLAAIREMLPLVEVTAINEVNLN